MHLLNRRRTGFTLIEILVVLGIITVLLAVLLPAVERAREKADNVRCVANLQQLGLAIVIYENASHGEFPRTVYDPAAPVCAGTNPAAVDPFLAGGPKANDVTAAVFLLMRVERVPAKVFCEPYTDEISNTPDPAPDPTVRSNFTDYRKNLGYSFANPYPSDAAARAGYHLAGKTPAGFAIGSCQNPDKPGKNNRSHEGRGQNVLYADDHVDWCQDRNRGMSGDDIYTNKAGAVEASPVDAADSVLLPTDE